MRTANAEGVSGNPAAPRNRNLSGSFVTLAAMTHTRHRPVDTPRPSLVVLADKHPENDDAVWLTGLLLAAQHER